MSCDKFENPNRTDCQWFVSLEYNDRELQCWRSSADFFIMLIISALVFMNELRAFRRRTDRRPQRMYKGLGAQLLVMSLVLGIATLLRLVAKSNLTVYFIQMYLFTLMHLFLLAGWGQVIIELLRPVFMDRHGMAQGEDRTSKLEKAALCGFVFISLLWHVELMIRAFVKSKLPLEIDCIVTLVSISILVCLVIITLWWTWYQLIPLFWPSDPIGQHIHQTPAYKFIIFTALFIIVTLSTIAVVVYHIWEGFDVWVYEHVEFCKNDGKFKFNIDRCFTLTLTVLLAIFDKIAYTGNDRIQNTITRAKKQKSRIFANLHPAENPYQQTGSNHPLPLMTIHTDQR